MPHALADVCVSSGCSVRDAMSCIDRSGCGIALVVDNTMHLLGTISDGDYRRAVLAGYNLDTSVNVLLEQKINTPFDYPITAMNGSTPDELLDKMRLHGVRQIPIIDDNKKVINFARIDDLMPSQELPLRAVVMAGGFGTRLRPLTNDMPKPMLEVGGKPVMEHVVEQLKNAGIRHVSIATHYKPEQIEKYFGDGSAFGVQLSYVNEDKPLGTGGALGLMQVPDSPLLIINGDIITHVNFRSMLSYHQEHKADMTVAVRQYSMQVPFGVVEYDGPRILNISEKPLVNYMVNAGIYLIEPLVYQFIPRGESFHMTDLIGWLRKADKLVVGFPVTEYWLDIGQHDDYIKAQKDAKNEKL